MLKDLLNGCMRLAIKKDFVGSIDLWEAVKQSGAHPDYNEVP